MNYRSFIFSVSVFVLSTLFAQPNETSSTLETVNYDLAVKQELSTLEIEVPKYEKGSLSQTYSKK